MALRLLGSPLADHGAALAQTNCTDVLQLLPGEMSLPLLRKALLMAVEKCAVIAWTTAVVCLDLRRLYCLEKCVSIGWRAALFVLATRDFYYLENCTSAARRPVLLLLAERHFSCTRLAADLK